MQKVMVKGLAKDERTLRELGVSSSSKVMVVGSTFSDVMAVAQPVAKVSFPFLCLPSSTSLGGMGH
jgi:hypothetical protein